MVGAVAFAILGAPLSAAAAPNPTLTGSLGRDTSGNLTFDLNATATDFAVAGGPCASSSSSCQLEVDAQYEEGGGLVLSTLNIPTGASSPYTHDFTGSVSSSKVVAVRAVVSGSGGSAIGNWVAATDPYVSPSVSVAGSVDRKSSGVLTYDITATETLQQTPAGACNALTSSCTIEVMIQQANGQTTTLDQHDFAASSASTSSYEFTGSYSASTKVVAIGAFVTQSSRFRYSSWVSVTDPLSYTPPAGSVSVDAFTTSRDPSTGNLNISVTETATNFGSGVCSYPYYACRFYVQAQTVGGAIENLAMSGSFSFQPSPHTETITYSSTSPQIVAIRGMVVGSSGSVWGAFLPVTDQYLPTTVGLKVSSLGRDPSNGQLVYHVTSSESTPWPNNVCSNPYGQCAITFQAETSTGDIVSIAGTSGTSIYGEASPGVHTFGGSIVIGSVVAVRTIFVGNEGSKIGAWKEVRPLAAHEFASSGNAAERGCSCNNGDPVNTQTGEYYDSVTDLGVPGVGPAIAVSRTYGSQSAATDGPFGYGWSTNFGSQLVVDTAGDSSDPLPRQVHIVQENGATVGFSESSSGTYPSDPWVLATLTHSSSTGDWTFTRTKGGRNTLIFDSSGKLISATDPHGNEVEYGYTGSHVTSVTGSGGRKVDLMWTGTHVTSLHDSAGRTASYGYDSSGNLTSVDAADGGIWQYSYDGSHLLLTQTKPDGGVMTNVYNTYAQVTSQTDEVGRVTGFSYSGVTTTVTLPDGSVSVSSYNQGELASLTTASGTSLAATTTYDYDDAGDLTTQTDPLGKVTSFTYDSDGNALTVTDPTGKVTTRTYDSLRDVLTNTDPLSRVTTMTYNSAGDMTSLLTPAGHTSSWTLNSDGTPATSTDGRGKVTTYSYDTAGRPTCATDPDGREGCQSYDSRGLATTKTDAAGKVTHVTYDDAGRVLTVEDPNSHTTTYVYDGDGNLTSTEDPSGHTAISTYDSADQKTSSTDGRGKTTTFTYTSRGSVATVTDPNGHSATNAFDAQNRLTSTTDADSHVSSYGYDLAGHKTSTTLPSGAVSSRTYDNDGRVATATDALGKVTTYSYDDDGEVVSVTDPLSRVTSYSYTDDGKLHVTTLPDSSTETSAYNADDVQTSFTNADGDVTSYSYDDAGLLSSETQPGSMTTSYSYDSAGRIHNVTTPDGTIATRSYDDAGRLTGINYPGTSDDVSYSYFSNGSRHTMTDGTGTTTYAYNGNGALTSVQNGHGDTISYGYDDASELTALTYPGSKTVTYGYDNADNMTSVTDWASRTTTLAVNADGLQATRSDPSGVSETRSYDAKDQLTDISSATSSTTLADYGYGYDNAGQLTSSTTTDALHTTAAASSWGYTALGQLSSTSPSAGYTTSPAGKLTGTTAGNVLSYNSSQELATNANAAAGRSISYSYDDNGSRSAAATTVSGSTSTVSSTYDRPGNLASVTAGGVAVTYQSDGDGLRQTRTVGGSLEHFLWDPNGTIPSLLDDGTHSYVYGNSTTPIAQIEDSTGTIEYLHADNVGSVRTIVDSSGAVVSTSDYSPYGVVTGHSGASHSSFGYASAWTDPTTGLDYLRAREYDPATGQFLQIDPALDQTRQPYEYVGGAPLQNVDPTGLSPSGDCPAPGNGAVDAEDALVQSWAIGCLPSQVSYGPKSGLVSDLKQANETKNARAELILAIASGRGSVGDSSDASYRAGDASLQNPNLLRDISTASSPVGVEPSVTDRLDLVLGTYDLTGQILNIDRYCGTAVISFVGQNRTTLGSALGLIPHTRGVLDDFAQATGIGREVDERFKWTEVVRFAPSP